MARPPVGLWDDCVVNTALDGPSKWKSGGSAGPENKVIQVLSGHSITFREMVWLSRYCLGYWVPRVAYFTGMVKKRTISKPHIFTFSLSLVILSWVLCITLNHWAFKNMFYNAFRLSIKCYYMPRCYGPSSPHCFDSLNSHTCVVPSLSHKASVTSIGPLQHLCGRQQDFAG